jgi:hypothetical protein
LTTCQALVSGTGIICSSYNEFRSSIKHGMGESVTEMNTFLVNLDEKNTLPSTFMFFAREMMKSKGKTKK